MWTKVFVYIYFTRFDFIFVVLIEFLYIFSQNKLMAALPFTIVWMTIYNWQDDALLESCVLLH